MKYILLFSLMWGILASVFSQNPATKSTSAGLVPSDYAYYFRLKDNVKGAVVYDVRTFKPVLNNFSTDELRQSVDGKHLLANAWSTLSVYDLKGNLTGTIDKSNKMLSPDWSHLLFAENGDLWSEDIKYAPAGISTKRKVTNLGIFRGNPDYDHWYSNRMIFRVNPYGGIGGPSGKDGYLMITDQPFEVLEWPMSKELVVGASPSGRYIFDWKKVVDLNDTKQHFYLENTITNGANLNISNEQLLWLDPSRALLTDFYYGNKQISLINFATQKEEAVYQAPSARWSVSEKWKENYDNVNKRYFNRSRTVSPDGKYFLAALEEYISGSRQIQFIVMNTQNGQVTQTPFNIPFSPGIYGAKSWVNDFIFEWISNDLFLVTVPASEGITRQGTYLYNLTSKEHKKLSPYIMKNCVLLAQAGFAVFSTTNNFLFKYHISTDVLTQMGQEPVNLQLFAFLSGAGMTGALPTQRALLEPPGLPTKNGGGLAEMLLRVTGGTTYFISNSLTFNVNGAVALQPKSTANSTSISFPFTTNSGAGGMEEMQFEQLDYIRVYSKALNQYGRATFFPNSIEVLWDGGGSGATKGIYNLKK